MRPAIMADIGRMLVELGLYNYRWLTVRKGNEFPRKGTCCLCGNLLLPTKKVMDTPVLEAIMNWQQTHLASECATIFPGNDNNAECRPITGMGNE